MEVFSGRAGMTARLAHRARSARPLPWQPSSGSARVADDAGGGLEAEPTGA
jgi:hypothetical protein